MKKNLTVHGEPNITSSRAQSVSSNASTVIMSIQNIIKFENITSKKAMRGRNQIRFIDEKVLPPSENDDKNWTDAMMIEHKNSGE